MIVLLMRNREGHEAKQIDALGLIVLGLVIAIIVGCVIAQIKISRAMGWQISPADPLSAEARTRSTSQPVGPPTTFHELDWGSDNSSFNADRFGYLRLNDGTSVVLGSDKVFSSTAYGSLFLRFRAGSDRLTSWETSDKCGSPGLVGGFNSTHASTTFLGRLAAAFEVDSDDARVDTSAKSGPDTTVGREMSLAQGPFASDTVHVLAAGQ